MLKLLKKEFTKPSFFQNSPMNGDHFAVDTSQMSNDTVNFSRLTNTGEECALPGATRYLAGFYKTATEQVSLYHLHK